MVVIGDMLDFHSFIQQEDPAQMHTARTKPLIHFKKTKLDN